MKPTPAMDFRLTKTDFLNFLKCPGEFWLKFHQPLLMVEQISLEHEHLRQQGYEVESYVKRLERFQPNERQSVDFQRTFQTPELFARTDIVVTDLLTGAVDIYEIKASSSVKDEHYSDVAFQKLVAERMGTPIRNTYVITMNSDYVRHGAIDVEQLFMISDVTEMVNERLPEVEIGIERAFAYLRTVPVAELADYCIEHKLDCRFFKMHFPDLPDYTVFDITFLKHEKRRELLAKGIIAITDVPEDFPLSEKQRLQVAVARSGEPRCETEKLAKRMDKWEYPLHFLDYETFQYAIPQFEGVRPFQQMVFQYSLHTIERPGAEPIHHEFLATSDEDPARAVAEHLRHALADGIGTVFVWYEAFEKGRNDEMAAMFPDLADFFKEVNEHTVDLMKVFSDCLYVHPEFRGRTSIKKVLPVLVPQLRYDELGISEGLTATIKWFRAVKWPTMSEAEKLAVFNDLLEYCELDSLAMVHIYYFLRDLCRQQNQSSI